MVETKVPARSEIPEKYQWNAPSVFSTPQDWEAEAARLQEDISQLEAFRGKLSESPARLREAFGRNAERLMMPASNMKLLTSSAALVRLGADFRYRTTVLARGARRGDTLAGDLVVVGRGDPSFSQHATGGTDVLASLRPWADSLRAHGIRTVTGRVVGDGSWFADPPLGRGWAWDDLADSYAAGVAALQFNEGFALLQVAPGDSAGAAARTAFQPLSAPLRVFGTVATAPPDSNLDRVHYDRAPFTDSVIVWGQIASGRAPTIASA